MTPSEVKEAVLALLQRIAPEARGTTLPDDADLRAELELDSMDFLQFIVGLHERLQVDVPEEDYPRVATLAGAVAYVVAQRAP